MSKREILIYVIGAVLFIASFFVGSTTGFFGYIQDPHQATLASLAFSIAVFVFTDRIAMGIRDSNNLASYERTLTSLRNQISEFFPIVEFVSSNAAMLYLCERIPHAIRVLNTKISRDAIPPPRDIAKQYQQAILKGIKKGLVYKDIVSDGFESYAQEIYHSSQGQPGRYEYITLNTYPHSFINFIILEFRSGEKELLIGWATSKKFGTEQKAYKITDQRVIAYYEIYFLSLWS